jgi:hypothetical protein
MDFEKLNMEMSRNVLKALIDRGQKISAEDAMQQTAASNE